MQASVFGIAQDDDRGDALVLARDEDGREFGQWAYPYETQTWADDRYTFLIAGYPGEFGIGGTRRDLFERALADLESKSQPVDTSTSVGTLTRMWELLFKYASEQGWVDLLDEFAQEHSYLSIAVRRSVNIVSPRLTAATRYLGREELANLTTWNSGTDEPQVEIRVRLDEDAADVKIEELWDELDDKSEEQNWCTVYDQFCDEFNRERTTGETTVTINWQATQDYSRTFSVSRRDLRRYNEGDLTLDEIGIDLSEFSENYYAQGGIEVLDGSVEVSE